MKLSAYQGSGTAGPYRGSTAALNFQKTFNTVTKRHPHPDLVCFLRRNSTLARRGTRDTTIAVNKKRMTLTHRIDPRIDWERSTVVNDLVSSGCVAGIGSVSGLTRFGIPIVASRA